MLLLKKFEIKKDRSISAAVHFLCDLKKQKKGSMSQKYGKRPKINKASDYASRENKHLHRKGRGPKRYNSHRGGRNSNFRRRPKNNTHNQPPAPSRRAKSQ